MLIIVDAPDLAGKSTIVAQLVRSLNYLPEDLANAVTTFHKRPPTHHPLTEYVEPLLGYRPGQRTDVVADRWHWGEAVYPQILGRSTMLDAGIYLYIEMFLRSRGALVVYPRTAPHELQERYDLRGDDLVGREQLVKIWMSYSETSSRSLMPVFRVVPGIDSNTTGLTDAAARSVLRQARRLSDEASDLNGLHTYVGPPAPDLLLVGDERPPRMDRDFPAFMPFGDCSGNFLMNAVAACRGRWPRPVHIGLVNSNDVDDVHDAWDIVHRPGVVALGRLADRRLRDLKIPHGAVPHPQFVRRFYQAHRDEYGRAIFAAFANQSDLCGWRPENPSWSPKYTRESR